MGLTNITEVERCALIDGDILAYEFGELRKKPNSDPEFLPDVVEGSLLPFECSWGAVNNRIQSILENTGATSYHIYLSSNKIKTWRFEIATIKPYKGNRGATEKPIHWELIRENLMLHHPCTDVEFIEADDALSIAQYVDYKENEGDPEKCKTIICTRDKDLRMVPGWQYGWPCGTQKETSLFFQDEVSGLRLFYQQLCTGDSTDNILGLYGVGKASSLVKKVELLDTEQNMFNLVADAYQDRFGSYWELFMRENGLLLKMQETQADRWNKWMELKKNYIAKKKEEERAKE